MIRLEDSIVIDAPPEQIWSWLGDLPRHYREWHPAHIACRYVRGDHLAIGAVLLFDERLHGKRHHLRLRATTVVPNRLFCYAGRAFRGQFELRPTNGGTDFTARLDFGWRLPLIGMVTDAILRHVMGGRLRAFQAHMREEGQNLKRLMESGDVA
jgi:hypothetical protein